MRWQIKKSAKVIRCIFTLTPTASVLVTFKIVDLEKVGHGHRVQFSQGVIRWQM